MKWTIAGAVALGGLVTLLMARPAEALPTQEVEVTYFSSAAMTTDVGWQTTLTCNGGHGTLSGTQTAYKAIYRTPCSSGADSLRCYSHGAEISCPASICDSVPEFCI